jgi:hypothetical protein
MRKERQTEKRHEKFQTERERKRVALFPLRNRKGEKKKPMHSCLSKTLLILLRRASCDQKHAAKQNNGTEVRILSEAGLPDGLVSNPKYQFGYVLEGLGMENVVIFMTICNILRPFGQSYGSLVEFVVVWYIFSVLVCLDGENLATLFCSKRNRLRKFFSKGDEQFPRKWNVWEKMFWLHARNLRRFRG